MSSSKITTRRIKRLLVGQSGGPTAAINASLCGILKTCAKHTIYPVGMRFGIEGLITNKLIDLCAISKNPIQLQLLEQTPSSWLGSCRYKLPDPAKDTTVYEKIFLRLQEYHIDAVLYIGGNDSMDTISKLSAYGTSIGSPIRFIGVPKTIDNDLTHIDHTPGYPSAAKFVATMVKELQRDADVYCLKSVTFIEIMGRETGWLCAASALAPADLIVIPERPIALNDLFKQIQTLLKTQNTVIVAISEGARDTTGRMFCECASIHDEQTLDSFGHLAAMSGASRVLAASAKARIGCKTRAIELSTTQRAAAHITSLTDIEEAHMVGAYAVQAALAAETGKMSTFKRTSTDTSSYQLEYQLVDAHLVANEVKQLPAEWISEDGFHMKQEFIDYLKPLILGEAPQNFEAGLPVFLAPPKVDCIQNPKNA